MPSAMSHIVLEFFRKFLVICAVKFICVRLYLYPEKFGCPNYIITHQSTAEHKEKMEMELIGSSSGSG